MDSVSFPIYVCLVSPVSRHHATAPTLSMMPDPSVYIWRPGSVTNLSCCSLASSGVLRTEVWILRVSAHGGVINPILISSELSCVLYMASKSVL